MMAQHEKQRILSEGKQEMANIENTLNALQQQQQMQQQSEEKNKMHMHRGQTDIINNNNNKNNNITHIAKRIAYLNEKKTEFAKEVDRAFENITAELNSDILDDEQLLSVWGINPADVNTDSDNSIITNDNSNNNNNNNNIPNNKDPSILSPFPSQKTHFSLTTTTQNKTDTFAMPSLLGTIFHTPPRLCLFRERNNYFLLRNLKYADPRNLFPMDSLPVNNSNSNNNNNNNSVTSGSLQGLPESHNSQNIMSGNNNNTQSYYKNSTRSETELPPLPAAPLPPDNSHLQNYHSPAIPLDNNNNNNNNMNSIPVPLSTKDPYLSLPTPPLPVTKLSKENTDKQNTHTIQSPSSSPPSPSPSSSSSSTSSSLLSSSPSSFKQDMKHLSPQLQHSFQSALSVLAPSAHSFVIQLSQQCHREIRRTHEQLSRRLAELKKQYDTYIAQAKEKEKKVRQEMDANKTQIAQMAALVEQQRKRQRQLQQHAQSTSEEENDALRSAEAQLEAMQKKQQAYEKALADYQQTLASVYAHFVNKRDNSVKESSKNVAQIEAETQKELALLVQNAKAVKSP